MAAAQKKRSRDASGADDLAVRTGRGCGRGGSLGRGPRASRAKTKVEGFGGVVCNKCKQAGHIAKKCTIVCGVCGMVGHVDVNCPKNATCGHCRRYGHNSANCSFGANPAERFLLCEKATSPHCFVRYFLVPLKRATADFDVDRLRVGRVDVGMRCITAALFRSQSLRTNSQVSLCFAGAKGQERVVQVNGALVRDLRPDERSLSERVRAVSSSSNFDPDAEISAELKSWSQSSTRGFYSFAGTVLDAARDLLEAAESKPKVLLLTAAGKPIETVIERLVNTEGSLDGGVLVLLGDDRGLDADDEFALRALAKDCGAGKLLRVSLGGDILFASHSIVLVNHYLDKLAHSCELREARSYG